MTAGIIQSHVDYWHFQCQKYQFMVNIYKFGIEKAIDMQKPKEFNREKKVFCYPYAGYFSKFQAMNAHYIKNKDYIESELSRMQLSEIKEELRHSIKMLKRWKAKFQQN